MPKLWKCTDALSGLISYQGGEGFTLVLTALHVPADRPEAACDTANFELSSRGSAGEKRMDSFFFIHL